jgi:two-component system cell cycle response regulator
MARSSSTPFAIEHDVVRGILIVERDPNVRKLQEHFLSRAGFTVEFADDGLTALDRARVMNPLLVVTEILIPKLDGLTLCSRLAADPVTTHIPVMVFSILSAGVRATEAGARAFVRKPLVETSFLSAIEDVIAANAREKE